MPEEEWTRLSNFSPPAFVATSICLKELLCDPDHMIKLELYIFVVCVEIDNQATVHVGRSEDNLQESVPSFHHVGLRDQAQVIRLGSWCFNPLGTSPACIWY